MQAVFAAYRFCTFMLYSCIEVEQKKKRENYLFLSFLRRSILVRCRYLNIAFPVGVYVGRQGTVVYCKQLTREVCCSQEPLTFWYTLQHPQGQKNETRAPASSCPINWYRTSETAGQLPAPTWASITGFDRSAALLAALLHCPPGQSAPQLALHWWLMPAPSAACQKEPGATEEVQISSNGLDPDGCAHDNRPPCLWLGFFCQWETQRPPQ